MVVYLQDNWLQHPQAESTWFCYCRIINHSTYPKLCWKTSEA